MRFALLTCGLVALALAQEKWAFAHYAAPVTCLIFAMAVQGMRQIRLWRPHGRPLGRHLVAAVPVVCLAMLVFSFFGMRDVESNTGPIQRANIIAQLRQEGGKHLVIVHFGSKMAYDCWVNNEADIDNAAVVWAHDMDAEHNRRLLDYFKDRHVWLLDTDAEPFGIVPYLAQPKTTIPLSTGDVACEK